MKANPKVGDVIEIAFLDHSEGEGVGTYRCFGRVVAKDRGSICVRAWEHESKEADPNDTIYTIMRKVVQELHILERRLPKHKPVVADSVVKQIEPATGGV